MMKKLLIGGFVLLGFVSCKENKPDEHEDEIVDTVSAPKTDEFTEEKLDEIEQPRTVFNPRFNFEVELPEGWKAVDKSNNGDGFYIDCGNKTVDIRIYGESLKGNEITAQMELEMCDKTEKFHFGDGFPGIKCFQGTDEYYYYDTPMTRIVGYVHAGDDWKKENAAKIDALIKSIKSGRQNFN